MSSLSQLFIETRQRSIDICSPLEVEDYVVQPYADVSPPKWHLGHTSWFFDRFIIRKFRQNAKERKLYDYIFNSYYKSAGLHWVRENRGDLSRPTVKEVLNYREEVNEGIIELLSKHGEQNRELYDLVEVGIHHEKQHQELLLMDIKAIYSVSPIPISYFQKKFNTFQFKEGNWIELPDTVIEVGAGDNGFSYDNERPRHGVKLHGSKLSSNLISNAQYLEFIQDQGYERPELWMSLGWDWIQKNKIKSPLYWRKKENLWFEYTLYGEVELVPGWPVSHISFFEANAYANWKKSRLPTEYELEFICENESSRPCIVSYHAEKAHDITGQLWNWSSSQYSAYPGFKCFEGSLGEYNGKFMCNQFVLRNASFATPVGHHRKSYRNFFEPWQRWMFSGFRIAKDK